MNTCKYREELSAQAWPDAVSLTDVQGHRSGLKPGFIGRMCTNWVSTHVCPYGWGLPSKSPTIFDAQANFGKICNRLQPLARNESENLE